jgi:quinol monooxygenase YgiN
MVADKKNPSHTHVFEMYTDIDAYKAHLEMPQFRKYKAASQSTVTTLNLVPMAPVDLAAKRK